LDPQRNSTREDDNTEAVAAVLALALGVVLSAFAGPEFDEASPVARWFESR
jgi:hypothetical protein